ncbi:N-acetyllactosaminide beta-1,3-N-acetylglucosaminyltransferase 2 [Callorhinchus milii]|uniref:Hexosyltransferase n=1 Tax=Callorhinchus milii TaxID=7868 RepID=V9KEM5_CALMI|nr:N-acetyllactosaminide beta-1,3-N-acetylglucosaminyltransferase 2 [Callorhinchus milii]XP_007890547.1 N-acetyllactosaminide beta-1,3-N-acetylglucosaminyltransferase 2 [Callorhinchus milii]XP_007890548.1 N-acetyllactosaminide beta-1,3-N-acetylglucosaminyltransferase 2 [Callorhinchus milii]XP_007890549.1 N-acetyllactosaminide beta-1,3-N-acetylglucosaminyltransferase 2 [Callorhinchus milii]XP_007890550.1 N-acetyllactosaminide beta-1,3-N-acetylglucosaminyltransferase 2 [Callorhinchus milii]XP_00|eukprot:gi/632950124/ref/XP_007890546.1/ PREDICTED: UDP-GlcNAc:betaGal beta-1,3-N-acetylglucosaminyltransferase 2 [Callorhinchus milii]
MSVGRKRTKLVGILMMVNIFIYIVVEISRSGHQNKNSGKKVILPKGPFWKTEVSVKAYWNREQHKLDDLYNPVIAALRNASMTESLNASTMHTCEPNYQLKNEIRDFDTLPDRFKDFLSYLRCRNYPLMIDQPTKCQNKPTLLLAIKSLESHFDRRQAIRQSWGKETTIGNQTIVRVFLLGKASASDDFPNLSNMLQFESSQHKDILLWDYRDTFFNLTLKEIFFLKWVSKSCPDVHYIFKGDDDVFVNTVYMVDYLETLDKEKAKDLFVGDVITNAGPHREKKLKYYVPENVFEGMYPPYAGGGGFLYSGYLAKRLYNATHQVTLYPIDDVYTGMCLRKLGLAPEKHKGFRTFDIMQKDRQNICAYRNLILVHSRNPQEMIRIWNKLQAPGLKC